MAHTERVPMNPGSAWVRLVVAAGLALGLAACGPGPVRGHAEIGPEGGAMDLGSIGASGAGSIRLVVDAGASTGSARIEVTAADGVPVTTVPVDVGRGVEGLAIFGEGPGPWTVRLVPLETPVRVDYEIRIE